MVAAVSTRNAGGWCDNARTQSQKWRVMAWFSYQEIRMYIGGGIFGTILVIALIVFLLRRG
jgi:hypothetical protein